MRAIPNLSINVIVLLLLNTSLAQTFYDCDSNLSELNSDDEALKLIKEAHINKNSKFSSKCLELLLKKNFF